MPSSFPREMCAEVVTHIADNDSLRALTDISDFFAFAAPRLWAVVHLKSAKDFSAVVRDTCSKDTAKYIQTLVLNFDLRTIFVPSDRVLYFLRKCINLSDLRIYGSSLRAPVMHYFVQDNVKPQRLILQNCADTEDGLQAMRFELTELWIVDCNGDHRWSTVTSSPHASLAAEKVVLWNGSPANRSLANVSSFIQWQSVESLDIDHIPNKPLNVHRGRFQSLRLRLFNLDSWNDIPVLTTVRSLTHRCTLGETLLLPEHPTFNVKNAPNLRVYNLEVNAKAIANLPALHVYILQLLTQVPGLQLNLTIHPFSLETSWAGSHRRWEYTRLVYWTETLVKIGSDMPLADLRPPTVSWSERSCRWIMYPGDLARAQSDKRIKFVTEDYSHLPPFMTSKFL